MRSPTSRRSRAPGAKGVSLKLIKLGGITRGARRPASCAGGSASRSTSRPRSPKSSIGTAAAVHLACAVPNVDWGVSLTNFYLAEDIVRQPIALSDGVVALPDGPGLGVEVDEAAVERFRVVN